MVMNSFIKKSQNSVFRHNNSSFIGWFSKRIVHSTHMYIMQTRFQTRLSCLRRFSEAEQKLGLKLSAEGSATERLV